jgi:hypothetical protein
MRLYRVFPFDDSAPLTEPGGALFAPFSGAGRIANPTLYSELYLSTTAVGALSEAFGRLDTWTSTMLNDRHRRYAIAEFELYDDAAICNLNNAGRLLSYELAPSEVVALDRGITQAWAARIYRTKKWIGIAWWSRYDSRWQSVGLWQRRDLRLIKTPDVLSLEHAAVRQAATLLPRRIAR